jgi:erythromycin esterase
MKLRRLFILSAMFSAAAAAADPPMLVNPSFRQGDPAGGKPDGWSLLDGGDGDVRTECDATCALHVRHRADGGPPVGVYQLVAPGAAAGHRLILSGRIRAGRTDSGAVLAVRVLGDAGVIGDNAKGPVAQGGTATWQRVAVTVPVPLDATGLMVGFVVGAKGDAWVDSLELAVDESVTVGAFVPRPPPAPPPRPVPSQQLLDDAALRLADEDMPPIPSAWRSDVRARRHPIRSLFSDDFSDLQFLKPLLAGKRIVQLGEASHGVAESNWAKVRLVKFLHQELGFDVIAFESSFDQCREADKEIGTLVPADVMNHCLFGAWRTREIQGLFDYMAAARKGARPLTLAGFDVQFSASAKGGAMLRRLLAAADAGLAARLDAHENELRADTPLTPQRSAAVQAYYGDVAGALGRRRVQLGAAGYGAPDIAAAIQTAHARAWLARRNEHLGAGGADASNIVRDAGMAEQMDFLLDAAYPHRKIIVWAHNQHVTNDHAAGDFTSMGERLAQWRRAEMYTVGVYMGHGLITDGNHAPYAVAVPPSDTVEAILANGGLKYAFVDFSRAVPGPSTAWFTGPNTVREFGTSPKEIVPARSFDGILYIDAVTAAEKY